jgi:hypothetical protein
MKTIYIAWQDKKNKHSDRPATRLWFPIGRLELREGTYVFEYTQGALKARKQAGFQPLDAFPDLHKQYTSPELFAAFQNRVTPQSRPQYSDLLSRLDLSREKADPIEVLAVTGGAKQSDNLELFPKVQKQVDGRFSCRFFLHGWRHVSKEAQDCLSGLTPDTYLSLALELNNPATGLALQMQMPEQYVVLGWAPRYLLEHLVWAAKSAPEHLLARVVRYNPPPAPHNQRVLIELSGKLPEGVEPMSGEDFQPLAA